MFPKQLNMVHRRVRNQFSRLDMTRKWLVGGALLTAISALMPWYEDLDAFGAGDLYLGVTGPLFLVGLMVLVSSLFVIAWIVLPLMDKKLPTLPVKEGALFAFLGVENLFLLMLANSVFFHPKFGVNITLKDTKFGMITVFIGVFVMIWSGYQLYRKEANPSMNTIGSTPEPLIKMPRPEPKRYEAPSGGSSFPPESRHTIRREPVERSSDDRPPIQPLRLDL